MFSLSSSGHASPSSHARPASAVPSLRIPKALLGSTSAAGNLGRDRRALLEHHRRAGRDPAYGAAYYYLRTGIHPESVRRVAAPQVRRALGEKVRTPAQMAQLKAERVRKEREEQVRAIWERVVAEGAPLQVAVAEAARPTGTTEAESAQEATEQPPADNAGEEVEDENVQAWRARQAEAVAMAAQLQEAIFDVRGLAFGLQKRLEKLPQPMRVEEALALASNPSHAGHAPTPSAAVAGFHGQLLQRGYPIGTVPAGYLYPDSREQSRKVLDTERQKVSDAYVLDARRSVGL